MKRIRGEEDTSRGSSASRNETSRARTPARPNQRLWPSSSLYLSPTITQRPTPATHDGHYKMLLSYYIDSFVPNISVANVPANFFTSVYVPMAYHCEAVYNAIIACASAHLAKAAPDQDRQAQLLEISLECQLQCRSFLRERISLSGALLRDVLEASAVILLLIGLEVQNGEISPRWVSQLTCVRNIIMQHGGKYPFCRRSWEARSIYHHFLYHDVMSLIMAGVTEDEVQDDPDDSLVSIESPANPVEWEKPWAVYLKASNVAMSSEELKQACESYPAHPLLGLSMNLFELIQKIRHVRPMGDSPDVLQSSLFLDLEHKLIRLGFELYPSAGDYFCNPDIGTRLDLVVLAEMYRLAALIILYRRSSAHSLHLPGIARHIVLLSKRIPEGNNAEAGLTYPLFLAGAELDSESDILLCAQRLMDMRHRTNVMNIQSVEKVLEEVWRTRLNKGTHLDWEEVLREWHWVINLG